MRLSAVAPAIYASICTAAIDSDDRQRVGPPTIACRRALRTMPAHRRRGDAPGAQTLLAEIAHRRGDAAAEAHFRAALAADATRPVLLGGVHATGCSTSDAPADVIALLQGRRRIDILLLRLALAQQALQVRPRPRRRSQTLRARFDASHARGDTVHQRENARFELCAQRRRAERACARARQLEGAARSRRTCASSPKPRPRPATPTRARRSSRQWLAETGLEYRGVGTRAASRRRRRRATWRRANEALALLIASALLVAAWSAPAHRAQAVRQLPHAQRRRRARSTGQWDIALRDLDFALGLDANQDGAITWGEVQGEARRDRRLRAGAAALGPRERAVPRCSATEQLIDDHSDGAYAVLRFTRDVRGGAEDARASATACSSTSIRSIAACCASNTQGDDARRHLQPPTRPSSTSRWPSRRSGSSSSTTATKACGTSGSASTTSCSCCRCCCRRCWSARRVPGQRWQPARELSRPRSGTWSRSSPRSRSRIRSRCRSPRSAWSALPSRLVESAIALSVVLAALNNLWPRGLRQALGDRVLLRPDPRLRLRLACSPTSGCRRNRCCSRWSRSTSASRWDSSRSSACSCRSPIALRRDARSTSAASSSLGSAAIALVALLWLVQRAFNLQIIGG